MAALCRKLALNALKACVLFSLGTVALPAYADTPYVGEIRVFGFTFCPDGWLPAQGQTMQINQNTALFSLLGTNYGGNGITTYELVDTQGRSMMGLGSGAGLTPRSLGEEGGLTAVTLTTNNLPQHSHQVNANNLDGDRADPAGNLLAAAPPNGSGSETIYSDQPATVSMAPSMISSAGAGLPTSVSDPSLAITICIATQGIYPSRP